MKELNYAALAGGMKAHAYAGNLLSKDEMQQHDPLANPLGYEKALDGMRKDVMRMSMQYGDKLPASSIDYDQFQAITDVLERAYGIEVKDYSAALGAINKVKSDLGAEGKLAHAVGESDFTFNKQCVGEN
jgi:hypothetical protein